jgi:hypothetical protein
MMRAFLETARTYQMAAGQGVCTYPRLLLTADDSLAFPNPAMTWPG